MPLFTSGVVRNSICSSKLSKVSFVNRLPPLSECIIIAPSSTFHSALLLEGVQPFSVWPSNSRIQPSDFSFARNVFGGSGGAAKAAHSPTAPNTNAIRFITPPPFALIIPNFASGFEGARQVKTHGAPANPPRKGRCCGGRARTGAGPSQVAIINIHGRPPILAGNRTRVSDE